MATFSKPVKIPRWGDDLSNILEPPEGQKDTGWLFEQIPPSNFENWRAQLNGDWWKWIDERWADGATNDVVRFLDPAGGAFLFELSRSGDDALFDYSTTPDELKLEADAAGDEFRWFADSSRQFSIGDDVVIVGRSATDGINMFGVGDIKALTFDTSSNQLRYTISSDLFEFFCDSASSSLIVSKTFVRPRQPLQVIDSLFEMNVVAGVASIGFDTNDSLSFVRASNRWDFTINSVLEWTLDAGALIPQSAGLKDIGTNTLYLSNVNAERFVPRGSFSTSPVVNRLEHGLHSAVTCSGRILTGGGVSGAESYNIASSTNPGVGQYTITTT